MTLPIHGEAKVGGLLADGLLCYAYQASRFGSAPGENTLPPDSPAWSAPDAGPVTSGAGFGGFGTYELDVPDSADYYVGMYNPGNPGAIAWELKSTVTHTSQSGWTRVQNSTANRSIATVLGTDVADLPQATINCADTTGFLPSGSILIHTTNGGWRIIDYTGTTSTSFTGCTNDAGTNGAHISNSTICQGYHNGGSRRDCNFVIRFSSPANGDAIRANSVATIASTTVASPAPIGIDAGLAGLVITVPVPIAVDPDGFYGVYTVKSGTGAATLATVLEEDF